MGCALVLCLAFVSADLAKLQASTDKAAVEIKSKLCQSLYSLHKIRSRNEKAKVEEAVKGLQESFLQFYEGRGLVADHLDPATLSVGQIGPLPTFEVAQVIKANEVHGMVGVHRFILRGISTADMANNQKFKLDGYWEVKNTETYETVSGGSNTIFVLVPLGSQTPKMQPSRIYPWYDIHNKVFLTGEFKRIDDDKAIFAVDGGEKNVPMSKIAYGDRDLIQWISERGSPTDTPNKR